MTRASDVLPWKPYVRADDSEPAAVTAARERWRQGDAELAALAAAEARDPLAVRELDEPPPEPAPPARRCPRCLYRIGTIGHKVACNG